MRTAKQWIESLSLTKHPTAGYFALTYCSTFTVITPERKGGYRPAHSVIYYLLTSEEIGVWRCMQSDETFHFYAGHDLLIYTINMQSQLKTLRLGNTGRESSMLQYTIPAETWFALEVSVQSSYSLVACAVTPAFDFADYEIANKSE